jgi:hypothetical protein
MAAEDLQVIRLRDNFCRDGFRKVLFALSMVITTIVLLIAASLYLFLDKPPPVHFSADDEWRILSPVPLPQPYLSMPDLIQWTSTVLPALFNYDFVNYQDQLKENLQYFTNDGWKKFLGLINNYAAYNAVQKGKLFIQGSANGAPFALNQGLLGDKYGWWVQMSVNITYSTGYVQPLDLQVLIVRVSTLNNLYGVAIDNIVLSASQQPAENKVSING